MTLHENHPVYEPAMKSYPPTVQVRLTDSYHRKYFEPANEMARKLIRWRQRDHFCEADKSHIEDLGFRWEVVA